jgi:voltage-gated potassium channel
VATRTTLEPLRDRYSAFVASHEVAWELVMAAVTICFVALGFVAESASPDMVGPVEATEVVLWAILAAEFASRFAAARDRRAYLTTHWIDALALVPAFRSIRLLRLLRLVRLVRAFAGIYRALSSIERFAQNRQLIWLFTAWLAVAVICSGVLYLAEVGLNDSIRDIWDALWWGVVTLTTVGYGDVYPRTPEGRLAAAVLMVLGITLFAAITGTITSALVARQAGDRDRGSADRLRELAALHAEGLVTDEEYQAKRRELLERL